MKRGEFYAVVCSIDGNAQTDVTDFLDFGEPSEAEIVFTIKGVLMPEAYLNEKYCNAEVMEVYALGKDHFLAVIDTDCGGDLL